MPFLWFEHDHALAETAETSSHQLKYYRDPNNYHYVGVILRFYRGYIGIMEKRMETSIL